MEIGVRAKLVRDRIAVDGRNMGGEVGGTFPSLKAQMVRYHHRQVQLWGRAGTALGLRVIHRSNRRR